MKDFEGDEGEIKGDQTKDGIILYTIHFWQLFLKQQPQLQKNNKNNNNNNTKVQCTFDMYSKTLLIKTM